MGYSDPSPYMFQIKTIIAEDITIIVFQMNDNVFLQIIIKGFAQYACLTQEDALQLIDALSIGIDKIQAFERLKESK